VNSVIYSCVPALFDYATAILAARDVIDSVAESLGDERLTASLSLISTTSPRRDASECPHT